MTAEGVLSFLLWFAGAVSIVLGLTSSGGWRYVLVGVLCIAAGEVTAG